MNDPTGAREPFNMKSALGQLFASVTHENDNGNGWELDGEKAVLVSWEDLQRVMELVAKSEAQGGAQTGAPAQVSKKGFRCYHAGNGQWFFQKGETQWALFPEPGPAVEAIKEGDVINKEGKQEIRECLKHGAYLYPRWTECQLCAPEVPASPVTGPSKQEAVEAISRLETWFKFFHPGLVNAEESLKCKEAVTILRAFVEDSR